MKCFIDGHEVSANSFARQPLNFNQPWPLPAQPLHYQIVVQGPDFLDIIKTEVERVKNEEIADAPYHRPGEAPELDRFAAAWRTVGRPALLSRPAGSGEPAYAPSAMRLRTALDRWAELGHPPAEELFARHPEVLEGVVHWMGLETLDRILPDGTNGFQYVLNSLDRVTVMNGMIYLEGRAYERAPGPGSSPQGLFSHAVLQKPQME